MAAAAELEALLVECPVKSNAIRAKWVFVSANVVQPDLRHCHGGNARN